MNFALAPESPDGTQLVSIKFVDVDALELSGDFVTYINRGLSEIGYKSSDDRDHDWLLNEDDSSVEDHLFFRFESDQCIRVHAHRATVEFQ